MFRFRRYRVLVVLSAIIVFLVFEFGNSPTSWHTHDVHLGTPWGSASFNDLLHNDVPTPKDQPSGAKAPQIPDPPPVAPPPKEKLPPPEAPPVPKPNQNILPENPPKASTAKPPEDNKATQQPPPPSPPSVPESNDKADVKEPPKPQHKGTTFPKPPPANEGAGQRSPPNVNLGDRPEAQEVIIAEKGKGRWPQDHLPTGVTIEHWSPKTDHFPVPTESIKPLPTGSGKKITKIQASFKRGNDQAEQSRIDRLNIIKEAFQHAWSGYRKFAWGKDELSPVSGKSRNTFNGWGATLVDSLDTLWVMGLTQDFEEAVEQVKLIDFHSSERNDIPLFETNIRYLGGLLGAYDVSDGKYPALLEQAVRLADLLMGAFDTPNRFPQTFYQWKTAFTSQRHRAPSRVVLAEIGTLQMEFTRLSQLTGNNTYYDAVARITDAMKAWQESTLLPGMWPAEIDTSGCNTTHPTYQPPSRSIEDSMLYLKPDDEEAKKKLSELGSLGAKLPVAEAKAKPESPKDAQPAPEDGHDSKTLKKRQVAQDANGVVSAPAPPLVADAATSVPFKEPPSLNSVDRANGAETKLMECAPKGLDAAPGGYSKFTLGSLADSAYEYLSKMYLLLNGQVEDYRQMYERSMDVANENLVFRVMTPDEKREIYAAGELSVADTSSRYSYGFASSIDERDLWRFDPQNSHLTCFVGGMFAMGSRLFDRPNDLEVAAKLTDGCVWAYESTVTGIMPETLHLVPCENRKSCPWNETAWHEAIDPDYDMRVRIYNMQMEAYNQQLEALERDKVERVKLNKFLESAGARAEVTEPQADPRAPPSGFDPHAHAGASTLERRNAVPPSMPPSAAPPAAAPPAREPEKTDAAPVENKESAFVPPTVTEDSSPAIWSPTPPLSREEVAKSRIQDQHLKEGMKDISDRRYILRPEALESVFYMHRITGDPYWRMAGWKMVASILKYTRTTFGHAAIYDVNAIAPEFKDEMESFWLAETLKYAYLLFDDEERYSLDDWVLNTEAHLFKRPKRVL